MSAPSVAELRTRAKAVGLRFYRSTGPCDQNRNMGAYRVVSLSPSCIVAGLTFDQEIEDVLDWIEQWGG